MAREASLEERLGVRDEDRTFGEWQSVFSPYFPQWQKNLTVPKTPFREGIFTFKVFLGRGTWRRIAIDARSDLDSLGAAILGVFDFYEDHLYEFVFQNRFGVTEHVCCPECQEEVVTSDVRVGDLPLEPGDSMVFHFDFGDDWQFKVDLERIEAERRRQKHPVLLESCGKAPAQYPE
ncbi:MAG: hypothetical protein HY717_22565 [Planctomycetes bacterium]|nr:hypothetical protein [Planctomycetota bacterium]